MRDTRNLASAAVAVVLGAGIAAQSARYEIGTPTQMGPGFFPLAVGVLVVILGIVLAVSTLLKPEDEAMVVDWRPLIFVPAALLVFAATLTRLGLVPSTVLLVAIASLAEPGFRPRLVLGVSFCLVVLTGLIFVYGLNMPLDLVAGS